MEQDEPIVFVGMRVDELPVPHVPSIKGECHTCHAAIWIGKVNVREAFMADRMVCVQCFMLEIEPQNGYMH